MPPPPNTPALLTGAARRRLDAGRREPALPPVAGGVRSGSRASSTPPRAGGCCGRRARAPSPTSFRTPPSRRSSARRARSTCSSSRPATTTGTATSRSSSTPSCDAGRAKGAHTILWLSYTENQTSPEVAAGVPGEQRRPATSSSRCRSTATWCSPTGGRTRPASTDWTWDGSHLTEIGSWLQTDFVSRWIAAIEHRPCPRPGDPGGPTLRPVPATRVDRSGAQRARALLTPVSRHRRCRRAGRRPSRRRAATARRHGRGRRARGGRRAATSRRTSPPPAWRARPRIASATRSSAT